MNDHLSIYTNAFTRFQVICNDLGDVGKANIAAGLKNCAALELKRGQLFSEIQSVLNDQSRGAADCIKHLRNLFGELTNRVIGQVVSADLDAAHACKVVENLVNAAIRMAQRITIQYTVDGESLPLPRKLFVSIAALVEQLADGKLRLTELDRALFWLNGTHDPLYHTKIGTDSASLLHNHPGLSEPIRKKLRAAAHEGRTAVDTLLTGTSELDAMLVRYGLEPVCTSDFLYAFFNDDQAAEFNWTSEIYGFDVVC